MLRSYAVHRHLPSFPTRRSSDLVSTLRESRVTPLSRMGSSGAGAPSARASSAASAPAERRGRGGSAGRSEEHTSELQSRGQLVCRLPLAKKNIALYPIRQLGKTK